MGQGWKGEVRAHRPLGNKGGNVNPIRSNTASGSFARHISAGGTMLCIEALWQHKAQIDDRSRQNPAYRFGYIYLTLKKD